MKKTLKLIFLFSLLTLLVSCSNIMQNGKPNTSSNNPWIGDWYGYIGETFYKLSFDNNTLSVYYAGNTSYVLLYKTEVYEYTSKSFNVTFRKFSNGQNLDRNTEFYGSMMKNRTDGFFLWNSGEYPFFLLD